MYINLQIRISADVCITDEICFIIAMVTCTNNMKS